MFVSSDSTILHPALNIRDIAERSVEAEAALAREQRIGAASSLGSDRSISDYEVRAHSWHSDGSPRTGPF